MAKKKQTEIPGAERKSIPELDEVVSGHAENVYEHKRYTEQLADSKAAVLAALKSHKLDTYTYYDGEYSFTVRREEQEKLRTERRALEE